MKATLISIVVAGVIIGGAFMLANSNGGEGSVANANNVSIVDGKQIIEITAKGGYAPRSTVAKAGIPTVLRVKTQGTFDCSSALTIPKLNYQKSLSATGVEEITVNPDQAQGTLQGMCSMGMYSFKIAFN
jgi:plastocyanin domain-containing protein